MCLAQVALAPNGTAVEHRVFASGWLEKNGTVWGKRLIDPLHTPLGLGLSSPSEHTVQLRPAGWRGFGPAGASGSPTLAHPLGLELASS